MNGTLQQQVAIRSLCLHPEAISLRLCMYYGRDWLALGPACEESWLSATRQSI